ADVPEISGALSPDGVQIDRGAFRFQLGDRRPRFLDQVRVERARQAAVGRDQHERHVLALRRLPKQWKGLGQLRRIEARDHLAERRGLRHQIEDHQTVCSTRTFSGLGAPAPFLYSSMPRRRASSSSLVSTFPVRRPSPTCGYRAAMNSWKPRSHSRTFATGTSSMNPFVTAKMIMICCSTGIGWYWPCLSTSTVRAPRSSCRRVAASK